MTQQRPSATRPIFKIEKTIGIPVSGMAGGVQFEFLGELSVGFNVSSFAFDGDIMWVTGASTILPIDVSDPSNMAPIGVGYTDSLNGALTNAAYDFPNGLAYALNTGADFISYDISDPFNVALLHSIDVDFNQTGQGGSYTVMSPFTTDVIFGVNAIAGIGFGSFGMLYSFDVSDPSNLAIIDTFSTSDWQAPPATGPNFLIIDGTIGYVTSQNDGYQDVFDLSDPSDLIRIAHTPEPDLGITNRLFHGDHKRGNYIISPSFTTGFTTIDVSVPTAPFAAANLNSSELGIATSSGPIGFQGSASFDYGYCFSRFNVGASPCQLIPLNLRDPLNITLDSGRLYFPADTGGTTIGRNGDVLYIQLRKESVPTWTSPIWSYRVIEP